jgi:hypothetical protein
MSKLKGTRWITLERCDKFISDTYFQDVNLKGKIFPKNLQKQVELGGETEKKKIKNFKSSVFLI